jgi:hypothetical protein
MHMRRDQGTPTRTRFGLPALLRRPGALVIAVIAVSDVAYRLLIRASIRRGLGMQD